MFEKLQEGTVENSHIVSQPTKDALTENYAWLDSRATFNMSRRSEKSISIINNTLNKLFKQGLLNKFHSQELKSIAILTKNLSK